MSNIPFTVWVMLELYFFVHVFSFDEMSAAILKYTKVPTPLYIKYCLKSYWLPGLLCANLMFAIYNQVNITLFSCSSGESTPSGSASSGGF